MFETVLVAARGEAARRVVRTCQRLGARAVTVHSAVDAGALHVTEADDSVLLGPAPPEQSYLDRRRVVEAARQAGASAVHPGSGALARDAATARAVAEAGLVWIGSAPEALDAVADAAVLRRVASEAGLPVTPTHAVGRHLSVPVLAPDGREVVALPPVDGSVQRRGQKVVEETPAPGLDDARVAELSAVAERVATAAGHRGLGAVELRLLPDGPALVAMTPHLPVEHPVTELVTGVDLVEQQLLLAAGEEPSYRASPLAGVAVELRVYAEDPERFDPAPGTLVRWVEPTGVRVDSGYREGDEVHPWYDPLLAKVALHAPTRSEAIALARAAVDAFVVEGPATNLPFLARLLVDDAFVAGRYDTSVVGGVRAGT